MSIFNLNPSVKVSNYGGGIVDRDIMDNIEKAFKITSSVVDDHNRKISDQWLMITGTAVKSFNDNLDESITDVEIALFKRIDDANKRYDAKEAMYGLITVLMYSFNEKEVDSLILESVTKGKDIEKLIADATCLANYLSPLHSSLVSSCESWVKRVRMALNK